MNNYDYIKDAFTKVQNKTNLEVNNLTAECITSNNNKFSLDSEGNLSVKTITAEEGLVSNIETDILNRVYPVGSIYLSLNSTHPATLFGGTWEQIAKGRTLIGVDPNDSDFDESRKAGGIKSQELRALIGATHNTISRIGYEAKRAVAGHNYMYSVNGSDAIVDTTPNYINHTTTVLQSNGNLPTTIQPYLTCYIWARTA